MILLSNPITSYIVEFSIIAKNKRGEFSEKIHTDQCKATKQYSYTTDYTLELSNVGSLEWIKNNVK